jgi:hypothetical protein
MGNGSGISRGDRNRNARLERLRVLVPVSNAIVGIDLAGSKQMVVMTDHDSKVIARRTFRCRAWDLGSALDWARERATAKGWAGVTVACEPAGHRWRVLSQLAADRAGAVRVRAAYGDVVVAADRGPDLLRRRADRVSGEEVAALAHAGMIAGQLNSRKADAQTGTANRRRRSSRRRPRSRRTVKGAGFASRLTTSRAAVSESIAISLPSH